MGWYMNYLPPEVFSSEEFTPEKCYGNPNFGKDRIFPGTPFFWGELSSLNFGGVYYVLVWTAPFDKYIPIIWCCHGKDSSG